MVRTVPPVFLMTWTYMGELPPETWNEANFEEVREMLRREGLIS
jgi:hypothetical protein